MRSMRRILLVLALYALFDFANPSAPGAVTFDGGVMETAKAERQRPVERPPLEPTLGASGPRCLSPTPVLRMVGTVASPPPMFIPQRSHQSADPVSPAEDH
jgi:hypothetical protein